MSRSLVLVTLSVLILASHQCYGIKGSAAFDGFRRQQPLKAGFRHDFAAEKSGKRTEMLGTSARVQPGHASPGDGLKETDKIDRLPGQPDGVDFNQYSGYVTANSKTGKAFFYYFVESSKNASSKPLVLWLSGGGHCSPFGVGALTEIGPFRVNRDNKTLHLNHHAWNREANILFVEFVAGLGFSYSNATSDYRRYGDTIAAHDTYSFLINWLKRFPEYKKADVFLVGEGYSGQNAIKLGRLILQESKHAYRNKINLKGVALGNAYIDKESDFQGSIDYEWTHAIISDEIYQGLKSNCNISAERLSDKCNEYSEKRFNLIVGINIYDIYSPLCTPGSYPYGYNGPCSTDYVADYIGNRNVQIALHAINADDAPYPWKLCSYDIEYEWNDFPNTVLPIISELMEGGVKVLVYSGDVSDYITVTAARYAINKLGLSVVTPWYPWYYHNEVGGYAVGYKNLVFASVRGAGQFVPASQPGRALELFSSFLNGKLPPSK